MGKSSIVIYIMRKIFFIPAQQIKSGGENIKWKIARCLKKRLVVINLYTGYLLFFNTCFKQQVVGMKEKFVVCESLVRIIDTPGIRIQKNSFVGSDDDRFIKKFIRKKANYVLKPGRNSMRIQQH